MSEDRVQTILCLLLLMSSGLWAGDNDALAVPAVIQLGKPLVESTTLLDLTVKNPGTIPTKISRVKTSCGCTAVEFPKDPIPPGESRTLKVRYHAGKESGPVFKKIRIWCEGLASPYVIEVRGQVVRPDPVEAAKPTPTKSTSPERVIKVPAEPAETTESDTPEPQSQVDRLTESHQAPLPQPEPVPDETAASSSRLPLILFFIFLPNLILISVIIFRKRRV